MATKLATKRLQKEFQAIQKSPPPFIIARPDEKDILTWHFIIRGPPETPYHNGEYWGQILFPAEYPFKPVDLKVSTPSGRFEVNTKLCLSYTSFHPSTWNAAWSVATILNGLLSFMVTDDITSGSIKTTEAEKKRLAVVSHNYNIGNKKFREIFPEYSGPTMSDLPDMGQQPSSSVNPPTTPSSSAASNVADADAVSSTTGQRELDASGLTLPDPNPTPFDAAPPSPSTQLQHKRKQDPHWLFSRWKWIFVGFVVIVLGRITSF